MYLFIYLAAIVAGISGSVVLGRFLSGRKNPLSYLRERRKSDRRELERRARERRTGDRRIPGRHGFYVIEKRNKQRRLADRRIFNRRMIDRRSRLSA
jgi:hypothetical protein